MELKLNLGQKGLILVIVPVIFEITFVCILFVLLRQAEFEVWKETHSRAVIAECNDIWRLCYDSGMSIFAFSASKQAQLIEQHLQSESKLVAHLQTLKLLSAGHKKEEELFEKIDTYAQQTRIALQRTRSALENANIMAAGTSVRSLRKEFETVAPKLIAALSDLTHYENRIAESSPQAQERSRALVISFLAAAIIISTIMAFALAHYFNKEASERLAVLVDNTRRLKERQPLNRAIGGSDEISHLDRVFHEMADALDDAARRKQELMSMVSHDLRSPLMSVEITLSSVSDGAFGELPESFIDPIGRSRRNTTRLIELINDLLDIEKLESGRLSMLFRECKLSDIFDRAFEAVAASAEQKMIDIDMEDLETSFQCDPDRLTQVLINLLSNAIKFSPVGASVEVRALKTAKMLELSVSDQGRGVPDQLKESIFDRFRQVEKSDGERGKGSGLGLAICKAIIEGHSGNIGVEDRPERGSRFWFCVPLEQKQEGDSGENGDKNS